MGDVAAGRRHSKAMSPASAPPIAIASNHEFGGFLKVLKGAWGIFERIFATLGAFSACS